MASPGMGRRDRQALAAAVVASAGCARPQSRRPPCVSRCRRPRLSATALPPRVHCLSCARLHPPHAALLCAPDADCALARSPTVMALAHAQPASCWRPRSSRAGAHQALYTSLLPSTQGPPGLRQGRRRSPPARASRQRRPGSPATSLPFAAPRRRRASGRACARRSSSTTLAGSQSGGRRGRISSTLSGGRAWAASRSRIPSTSSRRLPA